MPINKKPNYKMAPGKMYAGGSRDFNERTGTYRSTGKPTKRQPKPVNRGPKDFTIMPIKPRKKK